MSRGSETERSEKGRPGVWELGISDPGASGNDQIGFPIPREEMGFDPPVEGSELGLVLYRQGEQINIRQIFRTRESGKKREVAQGDIIGPKAVARHGADALQQRAQGGGVPDSPGISRGTEDSKKGVFGQGAGGPSPSCL